MLHYALYSVAPVFQTSVSCQTVFIEDILAGYRKIRAEFHLAAPASGPSLPAGSLTALIPAG